MSSRGPLLPRPDVQTISARSAFWTIETRRKRLRLNERGRPVRGKVTTRPVVAVGVDGDAAGGVVPPPSPMKPPCSAPRAIWGFKVCTPSRST